MHMYPVNLVIHLAEREMLSFRGARNVNLECIDGLVWLTVEGHHSDIVLGLGEETRIESNGLGLIQGCPSGTFQLVNKAKRFVSQESRESNSVLNNLKLSEFISEVRIHLVEVQQRLIDAFKFRTGTVDLKIR